MPASDEVKRGSTRRRLIMEGAVIALSILFAFWVDAAWELRRDRARALEYLDAVYEELVENVDILESGTERCERGALPAIRHLLTLTGPTPTMIPEDSLAELIRASVTGGHPVLRTSAFDAMISSGALAEVAALDIQQEFRSWQSLLDGRRGARETMVSRRADAFDYLAGAGATPRVQEYSRVEMPTSRFPLEVEALLSDPVFAGVFGNLGVYRGQLCQDDVGRLRQATELEELLAAELEE